MEKVWSKNIVQHRGNVCVLQLMCDYLYEQNRSDIKFKKNP